MWDNKSSGLRLVTPLNRTPWPGLRSRKNGCDFNTWDVIMSHAASWSGITQPLSVTKRKMSFWTMNVHNRMFFPVVYDYKAFLKRFCVLSHTKPFKNMSHFTQKSRGKNIYIKLNIRQLFSKLCEILLCITVIKNLDFIFPCLLSIAMTFIDKHTCRLNRALAPAVLKSWIQFLRNAWADKLNTLNANSL